MPCVCCAGQRTCADIVREPLTLSVEVYWDTTDYRQFCGWANSTPVNGCSTSFSVELPPAEWYGGAFGWWSDARTTSGCSPHGQQIPEGISPPGSIEWHCSFYRCSGFVPVASIGMSLWVEGRSFTEWGDYRSLQLGTAVYTGPRPSPPPLFPDPYPVTADGVSWEYISEPYFGRVCFSGAETRMWTVPVIDQTECPGVPQVPYINLGKWTLSLSGCS